MIFIWGEGGGTHDDKQNKKKSFCLFVLGFGMSKANFYGQINKSYIFMEVLKLYTRTYVNIYHCVQAIPHVRLDIPSLSSISRANLNSVHS